MVTRPQGRPGDRVYCELLLQMQIAVLSESADIRVVVSGCRNAGTCRGVCVFKLAKHLQLEELEASKGRPTCPLKEPLDNTEVGVPQASFKFHWHGQRGRSLEFESDGQWQGDDHRASLMIRHSHSPLTTKSRTSCFPWPLWCAVLLPF